MIRVLAIDPGERVGWATGIVYPGNLSGKLEECEAPALSVVDHGIAFLKDAALAIHKAVVLEDRVDVIVYETFILTHKGARVLVGNDLQTAQFVGMVRHCAWLNPRVQLVAQGPAAMSSAVKSLRCGDPSAADVQERIDRLPKSHDESHDRSALLHLWNYFFERYV